MAWHGIALDSICTSPPGFQEPLSWACWTLLVAVAAFVGTQLRTSHLPRTVMQTNLVSRSFTFAGRLRSGRQQGFDNMLCVVRHGASPPLSVVALFVTVSAIRASHDLVIGLL